MRRAGAGPPAAEDETVMRMEDNRAMQPVSPPASRAMADSPASDRLYDLSLRILMVVVSVGLVGSVAFLTYRWLAPPRAAQADVPVVQVGVKPQQSAAPAPAAPTKAEVLMNPGQIFKCDVGGRVTFSEQPCAATPGARKSEPAAPAAPPARTR